MKFCFNKNCKEMNPQPLQKFNKDSSNKDGLSRMCKSCRREDRKISYQNNKESKIKASKKWIDKNPSYHKLYNRNYSSKKRLQDIKRNYNLSAEEFDKLIEEQKSCCAICGTKTVTFGKKGLCVDHNHETNKVRGLLCPPCNMGLGYFKDNIFLLKTAINYLKNYDQ